MVELDRKLIARGAALSVLASIASAVLPVLAQPSLTQEAWQVQQGMRSGAISPNQATQMAGQIQQIQTQEQIEKNMNGGHLNGAEINQVHAEEAGLRNNMRGAAMSNGVNPYQANSMFGGHHHHQFQGVMSPYNQYPQQYQNMPYRQQMPYGYQNTGYGNGQPYYQNGGYPNQYSNYNQQQGGLSGAASMLKRLF
jgi:hypothetical protein